MASILDFATSLDPAQARLLEGKQSISEAKYDTLTLPAAALATTQFFANQTSDLAIKNFEGNGQLVLSGKLFLIQTVAVQITQVSAAATAANLMDLINRTAVRFQVDQKIVGTFATKMLTGHGGATFPNVVGAVAAAAPPTIANFGILNGASQNQPFRIRPMLVEGQKSFAAYLVGPTGAPITLAGTVEVQIILGGLQFQPIQ